MSILDSNITEEEKISGYSASEQGDESFKLETMDAYPGVFPEFVEEEEPIIPAESAFEDNEFEDDEEEIVDDEELNEELDEDFSEFEDDSEKTSEEFSGGGAFEDSDDDVTSFDDSDFEEEDSFSDDENELGNESKLDDNSEIEELSEEEIRALNGESELIDVEENEENKLELDADFKSMLESDLNKNQAYDRNNEVSDDGLDSERNEEFPIDDEIMADVIDFKSIEADKPSNFGIEGLGPEEKLKEESEDYKSKKEKKKEKNKKLIYIYGSVAGLLLISLVTLTILNQDKIFNSLASDSDSTSVDSLKISMNESKKENATKKKNKKKESSTKAKNISENKVVDLKNETDSLIVVKNEEDQNNNLDIVDNSSDEKEIPIKSNDYKDVISENKESEVSNNLIKKNQSKVRTNKLKKEKKSNKLTKKEPERKESKDLFASNKNITSSTTSSFEKNEKIPYPKKEISDSGLFTVQIYASQSKEDAMYWLNKLKEQNINDAFISEQIIRDEVWYRVRFGSFENKDKALEEASKLGYAQTWVDRVK